MCLIISHSRTIFLMEYFQTEAHILAADTIPYFPMKIKNRAKATASELLE